MEKHIIEVSPEEIDYLVSKEEERNLSIKMGKGIREQISTGNTHYYTGEFGLKEFNEAIQRYADSYSKNVTYAY